MPGKTYVIPCSGIGKPTASVGRQAAYAVVEELAPEETDTLCLSLLTLGDREAVEAVAGSRIITIDGCAKDCALKNAVRAGCRPVASHRVPDYLKEHRDLKPASVLDTGEGGRKLADIIARDVASEVTSPELSAGGPAAVAPEPNRPDGAKAEPAPSKVGVISCSGEALAEGTIARTAVRLVMEKYRPDLTVSLCLPLFLAGDGGEKSFAERFPVIAVDGCEKSCARLATEKYSGPVAARIDLGALFEEWGVKEPLSRSHPGELEGSLAERVASEIVKEIDRLVAEGRVAVGRE